jgi:hypothetical protein
LGGGFCLFLFEVGSHGQFIRFSGGTVGGSIDGSLLGFDCGSFGDSGIDGSDSLVIVRVGKLNTSRDSLTTALVGLKWDRLTAQLDADLSLHSWYERHLH